MIVSDPAAFALRFGATTAEKIVGQFDSGRIRDEGERITLLAADGQVIHTFRYNDKSPWPAGADGTGMSMQLIAPASNPDHDDPNSWVAAPYTPGDVLPVTVVSRYAFYDGSPLDTGGNAGDDASIATDKTALLPDQNATAANFTNYVGGITGIMVDVSALTTPGDVDPTDFVFRMGNNDDPSGWAPAPTPTIIVRQGEGRGNSDRIVITWDDDLAKNTWLEVTLRNDATDIGLPTGDVFYFGNVPGEVTSTLGAGLLTPPLVNAADVIAIRDKPRGLSNPASIDNPYDLNRDSLVNAVDLILARNNATSPLSALRLIELTQPAAPAPMGEGESMLATGKSGSATAPSVASLDGLMAAQAHQPDVDTMLPSATLSKLLHRLGSTSR